MSELYTVVLAGGNLPSVEDFDAAIHAAMQQQMLGRTIIRIEQGSKVILEGTELKDLLADIHFKY